MKTLKIENFHSVGIFARVVVACFLLLVTEINPARAQDAPAPAEKKQDAEAPSTNAPAASGTETGAKSTDSTNAVPGETSAATKPDTQAKTNKTDEIQVSFQGANVDMIVQWLAQTTGKSVVKHPQVQCQLTIMSSKKVSTREAISLVYRALSLEGFTAVESSNSILIVPEGKEPKLNPEVLDASRKDIPEGRQRLVKIFTLANIPAAELREKVRGVLSEKGTIESDDRANQVIVTDYNDNLRLLAELIREFDVPASGLTLQVYPLKHADAEELGNLLGLILNVQPAPAGGPGRPSSRRPGPPSGGDNPPPDSGGSPAPGGAGASASNQQVRIWPDRAANRLIISAPKSRQVEIERLLDVLDTDKSEDVTVRSIALKNVNAVDLVREIGPLYQKVSGRSTKDIIEVAANDRSNSLIILSSEANFRAIEKIIAGLDTEEALEKVVRTFTLKNADAEDVAKQLQDLNQDQTSYSRYVYYFSSPSGRNTRKMSVVSDRRRNSLIIQAPPAQMESIEKMIQQLDEPVTDDSLAPRIYPLKYVSAVDIEDVLNELFLKKTQQRSYWDFFSDYSPEPTADRDVGRLYGKVRITSEPYSNAIIVTSNSKESIAVIEDVLKQLDQPSQAGETTLRVQLRFAKAANVANSINILFAKNGSPPLRGGPQQNQQQQQQNQQQQQGNQQQSTGYQSSFALEQEAKEEEYYPWLGGQPDNLRTSEGRSAARPVSDLVGRVRAVADPRINSLMISANVHYFPQVMKLVEELDAPTAQVLIEARIVEVSSDFLDKLGVRWSPDGSKVFTADDYDNSLLAHVNSVYQQGYGGKTMVNTTVNPGNNPNTLPNVLTELRSGVLSTTISMDYLVQFLRKTTGAKVLAEPQINVADNERGQLFVGQQVPFIDKSQTTDVGALNQSFQYKDVGVVLEVTPHINDSGDVALKIRAEASSIVPGQTLFGGAIIDTREFRTDLKARTGETLVLGGIIQKQYSDTLRKTPILGDIPAIGWLFKKRDKTSNEVELMVFLRPKVTRTPQEAKELLNEIYKKVPNVKDAIDPEPKKKS
jgi:general secretion pathway protein D